MANDRVYQAPVVVGIRATDAKARVYQDPAVVGIKPTDAKAQVYQMPVLVAYPANLAAGAGERVQAFIID